MGNIGRPSGGCLTCKKRKIKCDETRPFCTRCKKANRECPGVPDPTTLAFRHRSAGPPTQVDAPPVMIEEMRYPVEQQAIALYFHDYANRRGDSRLTKSLIVTSVPEVYLSTLSSEPVHYALSACALSILARFVHAPELLQLADSKYVESIHSVRRALRASGTTTGDGTLAGIWMMLLWEMHSKDCFLDPFYKHKEGVAAILRKRGPSQFKDPQQLQTFRAWRSHLLMLSFESSSPLSLFDDTFDWFGDRNEPDDTIENTRLTEIGFRVADLRSRVALEFDTDEKLPATDFQVRLDATYDDDQDSKTPDDLEEEEARLDELCDEIEELDLAISQWFDILPSEWHPLVLATQTTRDDVWHRLVHYYRRPLAAIFFTFAHSLRIILNGLLLKMQLRRQIGPQAQSLFKIRMSVDAICATIPYCFGFNDEVLPRRFRDSFLEKRNWARANTIFQIHGIFFAAAIGDVVPLEQRRWLKGYLDHARFDLGYGFAGMLARGLDF